MPRWVRGIGLFGALALIAACDRTPAPNSDAASDTPMLRGTEAFRDFGDYVVYVNALMTDQLNPEIASEYGIVRSKSRAMLTISVHRKHAGAATQAVAGEITSSAVNLNGQFRPIALRQITEGDAIYYIGELPVNNEDTLIYSIDVTPSGETDRLSLRYQKQFFVDR